MKLAIMQPYFLPYIGYYQLISSADIFIVYDNIKYTKKGWINRNRMLLNEVDVVFSLPLMKDSDNLFVNQRFLADAFDREKLLGSFRGAYSRAPQFRQVFPLIENIVRCQENNLFRYIYYSLKLMCQYLGISTKIVVSSEVSIDHELKSQDKVLALCQAMGASTYINSIGGRELYTRAAFEKHGINLAFIQSKPISYPQFGETFIPWLSILDVLMFNPFDVVRNYFSSGYELV